MKARASLLFLRVWDALLCGVAVSGLTLILISGVAQTPALPSDLFFRHYWAHHIVRLGFFWAALALMILVVKILFWLLYRPAPSATGLEAPTLTVIIPAYNEGAMVRKSIDSVAAADYPADRLKIVVVDDGSKDDTWEYVSAAAKERPDLIVPVRFPKNRGKRAALAEGFSRADSDVVVTVDSDSAVDKDALLAIVGPMRDPKIGAVAGKVAVYNIHEGAIPKLLHVSYLLSFDFMRAIESVYGTVYCCPGALTALRAEAVRKVLPRWLGQKFMGLPCAIGEDRAMTNMILGAGYDAVYQKSAVVRTVVPTTYSKLCRMFIRWNRSYVREEFVYMSAVVWRRPLVPLAVSLAERLVANGRYPVQYLGLPLFVFWADQKADVLRWLLASTGLVSLAYVLYCLSQESALDRKKNESFAFGLFYPFYAAFALFWIFPYALVTARKGSWMTR
ncbi:MAG: glycosyltransferase [Elusimicrobia bacterium]|nr:glycosyltransferase [Elusimicrobiota bacterium]